MSEYKLDPKMMTKRALNVIERELRTFIHGASSKRDWTDFNGVEIPSRFNAGGEKFSFISGMYHDRGQATNGDVMDWYVGERLTPKSERVLDKHQITLLRILVNRARAYQIPHDRNFMLSHGDIIQFINGKEQVEPGLVGYLSVGDGSKGHNSNVMAFSMMRSNGSLELKLVPFSR